MQNRNKAAKSAAHSLMKAKNIKSNSNANREPLNYLLEIGKIDWVKKLIQIAHPNENVGLLYWLFNQ